MSETLKAIRGMRDILPVEISSWQFLEATLREVMQQYAYEEIRFPIVESTHLFKRSLGAATDVVEKEMYTFDDRNGDSLTLRPEGTASCVRACMNAALFREGPQRVWYTGPMFRHERPQKGRYRQFHQWGVEAFGMSTPALDVELIAMTARLWAKLGLEDVHLELNTLGTSEERRAYQEELVRYFKVHASELDEDSQRRLEQNPLRILDSKNPDMQSLIESAPQLLAFLGDASRTHFDAVREMLKTLNISFQVTPRLVRGLDYYTGTVFEWVTDKLGAQGTICAGGRYDGLVKQLGGPETPAMGFAMGLERLLALVSEKEKSPLDVYWMSCSEAAFSYSTQWAEALRCALPHKTVKLHLSGGNLKKQFKRANQSGADWAIVVGDEELKTQTFGLKHLRETAPQETLSFEALVQRLSEHT